MLTARRNIIIVCSCAALFFFACIYLYSKYKVNETQEFIGYDELKHFGMDELDYHFLATNFALANKFPVTGYILAPEVYRIKSNEEINLIYLDMFKKNGPVTSFMRPPLLPLLVGCMYKIFGFKYYYNLRLNILLLAIITGLMPMVGFSNWGFRGFFSGMIGALIFLKSTHDFWFLPTMGIDVFPAFLLFVVFVIGLYTERKGMILYYMIWGFTIGLSLLAKPLLTPFLLIFSIYILLKYKKEKLYIGIKKLSALFIGVFLTTLPWIIYANHIQRNTTVQREVWCTKVLADAENFELKDPNAVVMHPTDAFNNSDHKYDLSIRYFRNIVEHLWTYHSRTTVFIFITNSFGDGFLNLNNEYCTDINIHYEWRYIKSSFYRSYCTDDQSAIIKMLLFYYHNPSYMCQIPVDRLLYPLSSDYHRYYWLTACLWGLCMFQIQLYTVKTRTAKLLLTLLLIILTIMAVAFSLSLWKYAPILFFIPLFIAGVLLSMRSHLHLGTILSIFPVIWSGLFVAIFVMVPNTRYMLVAMPVSCLCIPYLSLSLLSGFKYLALGNSIDFHQPI